MNTKLHYTKEIGETKKLILHPFRRTWVSGTTYLVSIFSDVKIKQTIFHKAKKKFSKSSEIETKEL